MSDTYRILITGSRDWDDYSTLEEALIEAFIEGIKSGRKPVLVSGACPTGADHIAERIWGYYLGAQIETHPADWSLGRKAGPLRNQKMVDLGADVCYAFIKNDSKGASGTVKMALDAGIRTVVYRED